MVSVHERPNGLPGERGCQNPCTFRLSAREGDGHDRNDKAERNHHLDEAHGQLLMSAPVSPIQKTANAPSSRMLTQVRPGSIDTACGITLPERTTIKLRQHGRGAG
jgi:hypothetical protein